MSFDLEAYANQPAPVKIKGVVQHYAWGGYHYIPKLINQPNPDQEPYAEYWLGANPQAPAVLAEAPDISLADVLSAAPQLLGSVRSYRSLPFLFKVLDAEDMLSIQVHPSKKQAEKGFAREEKKGIPLDDPARSYKDDNHKPEVHVALTDFWMLHGFRPINEIEDMLEINPEFNELMPILKSDGLEGMYKHIMTLPQENVDEILTPLVQRLRDQFPQDPEKPDYWALAAAHRFPAKDGKYDRGLFSLYLLNLLHLKPGQGTYQPAGVLHAYLHGFNVELMANSDNVLRGGLTPKHINVKELLKTVNFEGGIPEILTGAIKKSVETVYETPSPEFELSKIILTPKKNYKRTDEAPAIFLVLDGHCRIGSTVYERGEAAFVPADIEYEIATEGSVVLYKATVGK